jgi:DNA-directed RNA polymerase subunit E'/Rpb7
MDPLFERRDLYRNVHIASKLLQKNMLQSILKQLRMNLEGHCSSEGFIQQQSITILEYSVGRANYVRGGIDYQVKFQADVCLPHKGQTFKGTTELRSKIGIHAVYPPLKILIPRDLHIGNEEFDGVKEGSEIEFEVIDFNFKQMDKEIVIIGKLKSELKAAPLMPLLSAESEITIPTNNVQSESNEKVVTVMLSEPEPKKRKLKRKTLEETNESVKAGIDESST